jgi:hypothetical protein
MATRDEIQRRVEAFTRELCEELGEIDEGSGDCWLDAVENRAIAVGDAVAAALVAQQAVRQPVAEEETTCPACGKKGRYRGLRQRELITRRGPAVIAEPEYYCPCCRKAFFPDDPRDGC